ncbi:transcription factor IIA, alpha/beta subunit [Lipomyces kononenkoae]
MSNNIVGAIYRDIVEDVINSSRIDFEDSGVDESTLRELKLLWQERLTISGVATFPWDAQPALVSETRNREAKASLQTLTSMVSEGNVASTSLVPQTFSHSATPVMRASQKIPEFGMEESVLTETANESASMNRGGKDVTGGVNISSGSGSLTLPDGDRLLESRISYQKFGHSESAIKQAVSTISIQRNKTGNTSDNVLSQMDGPSDTSGNDLNDDDAGNVANNREDRSSVGCSNRNIGEDSDAINSDLDDSEEVISQEEEVEGSDAIILCLYERVVRMKSKWRFDLRDGIIHANGKDYLFGKASGECEW